MNMNNIIVSVKKFFQNKNTVTILGVVVIITLLYFGYTSTINKATSPVRIPVAKQTIQPRTQITSDMVTTIDVPSIAVTTNAIRYTSQIIGKYTNINAVIPAGSMFYQETLIKKEDLPNSAFVEVKDGEAVYNFPVDLESTYGNSIMPNDNIDIYMKAENEAGQVMVGRLLKDVKVLAVKDYQGNHVFENTEETRTPSYLIFGLEEVNYILLRKASYMRTFGVELFPVIHGGSVNIEGATVVDTQFLKDFIEANTVTIETTVE